MINHRFQGLAKKICKTQAIVLAKRLKVGVRSSKLGILDGGFDFVKVQGLKQKKMGNSVIIIELVWTQGKYLFKIHHPSFKTGPIHSIMVEFDCKKYYENYKSAHLYIT